MPLLEQASCHGNHDASFMLATLYSKGVAIGSDDKRVSVIIQQVFSDLSKLLRRMLLFVEYKNEIRSLTVLNNVYVM